MEWITWEKRWGKALIQLIIPTVLTVNKSTADLSYWLKKSHRKYFSDQKSGKLYLTTLAISLLFLFLISLCSFSYTRSNIVTLRSAERRALKSVTPCTTLISDTGFSNAVVLYRSWKEKKTSSVVIKNHIM